MPQGLAVVPGMMLEAGLCREVPPAASGIWESTYSRAVFSSFPACCRFQGNKIPQARAEVSHLNVTQAHKWSCQPSPWPGRARAVQEEAPQDSRSHHGHSEGP